MPTIDSPVVQAFDDIRHLNTLYFPPMSIRADVASVTQYLYEINTGFTLSSYVSDPLSGARFANDGARLYNYWDSVNSEWLNGFGFEAIVVEITHS